MLSSEVILQKKPLAILLNSVSLETSLRFSIRSNFSPFKDLFVKRGIIVFQKILLSVIFFIFRLLQCDFFVVLSTFLQKFLRSLKFFLLVSVLSLKNLFLNPQPQHSFLKILKKKTGTFAVQQQTSTFRRQKIDPFYLKFRAELNQFVSRLQKQQEEAHKLLKPPCGRKTYAVRLSSSKGQRRRQEYSITLEIESLGHYLIKCQLNF